MKMKGKSVKFTKNPNHGYLNITKGKLYIGCINLKELKEFLNNDIQDIKEIQIES